jgi:hypothetical protein
MDRDRFDALAKMFATVSTRRSTLAVLSALGLAGGLTIAEDAAARKKRKKKCKKKCGPCKKCKRGKCKPKPDGTACGGGKLCQGGACVCPAGQKVCGGACIDDTECCGACPQGETCCENVGECKDVRNDDGFCGQCANGQCPDGSFCANGACGLTCVQNGMACSTGCDCGSRVDPDHTGQLVCAGISPFTCDNVTTCTTDADCAPATQGFRQVCVSDLCAGKNVCADPCA